MSREVVVRCGCGDELVTTDPVNRRAVYWCPRCLDAEIARVNQRFSAPRKGKSMTDHMEAALEAANRELRGYSAVCYCPGSPEYVDSLDKIDEGDAAERAIAAAEPHLRIERDKND